MSNKNRNVWYKVRNVKEKEKTSNIKAEIHEEHVSWLLWTGERLHLLKEHKGCWFSSSQRQNLLCGVTSRSWINMRAHLKASFYWNSDLQLCVSASRWRSSLRKQTEAEGVMTMMPQPFLTGPDSPAEHTQTAEHLKHISSCLPVEVRPLLCWFREKKKNQHYLFVLGGMMRFPVVTSRGRWWLLQSQKWGRSWGSRVQLCARCWLDGSIWRSKSKSRNKVKHTHTHTQIWHPSEENALI